MSTRMTDKSLILWYLYTAHSLFNVEWQNELCDITMALVSIARLYCAVVLNDVMQTGAGCGHKNIQIESL